MSARSYNATDYSSLKRSWQNMILIWTAITRVKYATLLFLFMLTLEGVPCMCYGPKMKGFSVQCNHTTKFPIQDYFLQKNLLLRVLYCFNVVCPRNYYWSELSFSSYRFGSEISNKSAHKPMKSRLFQGGITAHCFRPDKFIIQFAIKNTSNCLIHNYQCDTLRPITSLENNPGQKGTMTWLKVSVEDWDECRKITKPPPQNIPVTFLDSQSYLNYN